MKNKAGKIGEDTVCEYLIKKGRQILARNYHSRYGEIDIIVRDGEYTAFVEVKTRLSRAFASPCEFVDLKKQDKIIKTAALYMQKMQTDSAMRFDVAEVIYNGNDVEDLNYIENAFWT